MGNKNGSYDALSDETKQLLMQRTGRIFQRTPVVYSPSIRFLGMSQFDLEIWYKAILVDLKRV